MKGTRQKYVERVVRELTKLVDDMGFYLLLPDADDKVEETFYKLKKLIERTYNQYHEH